MDPNLAVKIKLHFQFLTVLGLLSGITFGSQPHMFITLGLWLFVLRIKQNIFGKNEIHEVAKYNIQYLKWSQYMGVKMKIID